MSEKWGASLRPLGGKGERPRRGVRKETPGNVGADKQERWQDLVVIHVRYFNARGIGGKFGLGSAKNSGTKVGGRNGAKEKSGCN